MQGLLPLRAGRFFAVLCALSAVLCVSGCGAHKPPPGTVTMLIESSPANLDPRIGTDGQAEHIDALIFDPLVWRDAHFGLQPGLATAGPILTLSRGSSICARACVSPTGGRSPRVT